MGRVLAVASSVLFALAPLSAQARKPLVGTVVDAAGKPVAGAAVQLTVPGRDGAPPLDALDATTDERGRFRVQALPCTSYQAWAAGPAADDGTRKVSEVAALAVGQPASLAVRWTGGEGVIEFEGLDAWQARAPFTLRATIAGRATDVEVKGKDGVQGAPLAAQPREGADFALFDRDGRFVHGVRVAARANVRMRVPPPFELKMKVVDEKGQPIAGARIARMTTREVVRFARTSSVIAIVDEAEPLAGTLELGVTGPDGVLKALVASRSNPLKGARTIGGEWRLCATAPGRAPSYGGADFMGSYEDGKVVEAAERDSLTFTLRPSPPLRVRVVDGERPVAGVAVTLRGSADMESGQGWSWPWPDPRRATTDADGWARLESPPTGAGATQLRFELAGPLSVGDGQLPMPARPVLLAPISREGAAPDAEVVLDLATLATVTFAVRDESGGPGRGAQVVLLPAQDGDVDGATTVMTPDAAGRLAVRLTPGDWIAIACTQDGYAMLPFVAGKTAEAALTMAPFPSMRARLVDGDGKPVAGAHFAAQQFGIAVVDVELVEDEDEGKAADSRLRQLLKQHAQRWNRILLARGKSDADGVFRTPYLPVDGADIRGRFHFGRKESGDQDAVAGDLGDVVLK